MKSNGSRKFHSSSMSSISNLTLGGTLEQLVRLDSRWKHLQLSYQLGCTGLKSTPMTYIVAGENSGIVE